MNLKHSLVIPADVPENKHDTFIKNYTAITRDTGKLFLFSCDHKIEHLNTDFYGEAISPQAIHPDHMFRIASQGNIGAMATQLGLITRYAKQYPHINYIVKLNSSTHLCNNEKQDKKSYNLWNIDDVIRFKHNNPKITVPGIGITVYIGNQYESEHLAQAAQAIAHAHNEGLVTVAWVYVRGKDVASQENNPDLIAGAAGVGLSLGADFIKIKQPAPTEFFTSTQSLKIASATAGNSKLLCAGGERIEQEKYLAILYDQIHNGDTSGTATGRNIFQHSLPESIALTHAIAAIVYENADCKTALDIYQAKCEKRP
jgi:DhnA family fructose-bisphosphate aldolase class Ia